MRQEKNVKHKDGAPAVQQKSHGKIDRLDFVDNRPDPLQRKSQRAAKPQAVVQAKWTRPLGEGFVQNEMVSASVTALTGQKDWINAFAMSASDEQAAASRFHELRLLLRSSSQEVEQQFLQILERTYTEDRVYSSSEVVAELGDLPFGILFDGKRYSLSDLNGMNQEKYFTFAMGDLESIWEQLENLARTDAQSGIKNQVKDKVHNAWELRTHLDASVSGDGSMDGWEEEYGEKPGAGDSLHDYVYRAIISAMGDQSTISEMSYDKVHEYLPATQLAYCLKECRDSSEAVLALCLYTSYFYEPLNNYLRGLKDPGDGDFGRLVVKAAEVLKASYESQSPRNIKRRYRLELRSGWIADDQQNLDFAAPTSTHPNMAGVNEMWSDLVAGKYGKHDNFALLIFEGTAKMKRPTKKYFSDENEELMGPGAAYKVTDKYSIEGPIKGLPENQTIRVFHLSNVKDAKVGPAKKRVRFAGESRLVD